MGFVASGGVFGDKITFSQNSEAVDPLASAFLALTQVHIFTGLGSDTHKCFRVKLVGEVCAVSSSSS